MASPLPYGSFYKEVALSQVGCRRPLLGIVIALALFATGCVGKPAQRAKVEPEWNASLFREISVQAQTRRSPVLAYDANSLPLLEMQVARLANDGWKFLTLPQLQRRLATGEDAPAKSVALTFDMSIPQFYAAAHPLLQKRRIPAALFVTKPPKEGDSDLLSKLDREGLVFIGVYWSIGEQNRALSVKRKAELEAALGRVALYCAYENNANSPDTPQALAKEQGFVMALSTQNGLAEESPSMLSLNRYAAANLEQALADFADRAKTVPLAVVDAPMRGTLVQLEIRESKGVRLAMLIGGRPSFLHDEKRRSVGEFVNEANGAAGSSGTFFTGSSMRGTPGESLVGPYACDKVFKPDEARYERGAINNRPMVLWGEKRIAIFPFQNGYMNRAENLRAFMPDFTDGFLGGAWIVHNGVARGKEEWAANSVPDIHDPRFRIFFGLTKEGTTVIGASMSVITTERLAKAAQDTGIKEAVLLDSGFSTSIVYLNRVVVTGHTDLDIPSRPVPSSIVLHGGLAPINDLKLVELLDKALPAAGEGSLATNEKLQWASNRKRLSRKTSEEREEP